MIFESKELRFYPLSTGHQALNIQALNIKEQNSEATCRHASPDSSMDARADKWDIGRGEILTVRRPFASEGRS